MPGWNFDMSKAPRGRYRLVPSGNGKSTRKVFEPARVVLASSCGIVTVSHWIDTERRWEMFAASSTPLAWMPFDGPQEVTDEDGKTRMVVVLPDHPTMQTSWFDDLLASRRAA